MSDFSVLKQRDFTSAPTPIIYIIYVLVNTNLVLNEEQDCT